MITFIFKTNKIAMKTFCLFFFSILPHFLFAQVLATTENGREVILNKDGTWQYQPAEPAEEASLDCSDLVTIETDRVTGKKTKKSAETLLVINKANETGFGIMAAVVEDVPIVLVTAVGASKCIEDDSKASILFRDGTQAELVNNGDFNCKEKFALYFGKRFGNADELEMFKTKEIETLRVWTAKGYVEEDFTSQQSKIFKNTIGCLVE